MINTKTVFQSLVNISECKNVQELKDTLQAAVGNVDIVHYQILGKLNVLVFIETLEIDGLVTFKIEVPENKRAYSLINIVESLAYAYPHDFNINDVSAAFAEEKGTEPFDAKVIIFDKDPELLTVLEKSYPLSDISVYNGLVSIKDGSTYVLIEPQVHVIVDYSTFNNNTGTVKLKQYEVSQDEEFSDEEFASIVESFNKLEEAFENIETEENNEAWFTQFNDQFNAENSLINDKLKEDLDMVRDGSSSLADELLNNTSTGLFYESDTKKVDYSRIRISDRNMEDMIKTLDAIENDQPYELPKQATYLRNEREKNVQAMKELLETVYEVSGDTTSMAQALKGEHDVCITMETKDATITTITAPQITVVADHDADIEAITIGDTVTESIKLKVALISLTAFDTYASNHNIVGWTLNSPTTLMIKYMDGVTSSEKIAKFHEMMDSLGAGWIDQSKDAVSFFSDFHKVVERDLEEEFLTRVHKHNIFVRDSYSKIRSALIDMEKDYELLKDEINLIIDWKELTAHASKKERTETRTTGVKIALQDANLVKVNSGLESGDFFIPFELLTDEIRSKYVLDNTEYSIDNVPSYAFYEVRVNGHVILIEKTDL